MHYLIRYCSVTSTTNGNCSTLPTESYCLASHTSYATNYYIYRFLLASNTCSPKVTWWSFVYRKICCTGNVYASYKLMYVGLQHWYNCTQVFKSVYTKIIVTTNRHHATCVLWEHECVASGSGYLWPALRLPGVGVSNQGPWSQRFGRLSTVQLG